jgi:hydrogenase maturation factor HypF (carbamoyltransferase family)
LDYKSHKFIASLIIKINNDIMSLDLFHQRVSIRIHGQLGGASFPPFVSHLATTLDLSGFVCMDSKGVAIEVQGHMENIEKFLWRLTDDAPAGAKIDMIQQNIIKKLSTPSSTSAFEVKT